MVWKLFSVMKFCNFVSYSCVGRMAVDLSLSAFTIIASFFLSFYFTDLSVCISQYVL